MSKAGSAAADRGMNGVAEALIGVDEDGLSFDAGFAAPHRLRKMRISRGTHMRAPAHLARRPSGFEIAGQQMQER
jgi:hypothetical protein